MQKNFVTIALLTSVVVAGAVRYPSEGPLRVADDEAERLIDNGQAELVEDEAEAEAPKPAKSKAAS